ncbi:MAG: SCO family protein [Rhizobiales bacterium]|nr:SCO family protein [Hyphomicrobiales bacterium]MBI3673031.1 SCO family protein [Hyphomicrobiales bacterium]
MPSRRTALLAAAILAMAALLGMAAYLSGLTGRVPVSIGVADVGGPFSLVDQDGKRVTEKDFRGRYMLVFFGYTSCPDVCPAELQVMTQAVEAMGEKSRAIQPIFVTIDPERDSPATLKAYVGNFGAGLVGLTGSAEDVAAAAKAYRVYYRKVDQGGAKTYAMDHSSIIYLMAPDGSFVKFFTYSTDTGKLAKELAVAMSG